MVGLSCPMLGLLVFGLLASSGDLAAQQPAPGVLGPEHDVLTTLVGSWEVSVEGQVTGRADARSRLDGRFIEVELTSEGGPVNHAIYTFGFDRRHGVYNAMAMDNSGTYWVTGSGTREGTRIKMYGTDEDPVMRAMGFDKEFIIVLDVLSGSQVAIEILFIDTRTPERTERPFLRFDLRRQTGP